jgi:NDP-sugar pyrophosphorylase family protein
MDPLLLILAGGISSRMKRPGPTTLDPALLRDADEKAKGMIGVGEGGRPFLDYLLRNAEEAGYRDVTIVIGENDTSVRSHYGARDRGNRFRGLEIGYALQPIPPGRTKPLGTADATMCGLRARPDWAGCKVTVCNSDNLYSVTAMRTLRESAEPCALIDYDRAALDFEHERIEQFAVVEVDHDGYLRRIIEKPSPEQIARAAGPGGRIGVSMNIFRLSVDLASPYLASVPLHPVRGEAELPSALMMLVADHPRALRAYPLAEHVPDLTNKADIARVQAYLRGTHASPGGSDA